MTRKKTYGSPIDYAREGQRIGRGPNAAYKPSELRQRAVDYFDYMRGKVWNRADVLKSGFFAGTLYEVPTSCPLDLKGFFIFAGIGPRRWEQYKGDEAYVDVCEWIEMIIEVQNYEGAAVGVYSANLIARRHKIADKTETDTTVSVDHVAQSPLNDLSLEQLDAINNIIHSVP